MWIRHRVARGVRQAGIAELSSNHPSVARDKFRVRSGLVDDTRDWVVEGKSIIDSFSAVHIPPSKCGARLRLPRLGSQDDILLYRSLSR